MKEIAQKIAGVVDKIGIFGALENLENASNRLRVLTYHRVSEANEFPHLEPGLISATPAEFREQMTIIKRHYNPIGLSELKSVHEGGSLPNKAVLVTFDDGYIDFAKHAWPVLRELGIPVLLFVPSDFPAQDQHCFWWDRLYSAIANTERDSFEIPDRGEVIIDRKHPRAAYKVARAFVKSLPHAQAMTWVDSTLEVLGARQIENHILSWGKLRKLAEEGVVICPHGKTHALMTNLTPEELSLELIESKKHIETEIPNSVGSDVIAYPSNAYNAQVLRAVADSNYTFGFGGPRNMVTFPQKPDAQFAINRFAINRFQTGLFRAQLRPSVSRLGSTFFNLRERYSA